MNNAATKPPDPFVPPASSSTLPTAPVMAVVTSTPPGAVMPAQSAVPPKPPKKDIKPSEGKILGAKIVLTFRGEDGQTYESAMTISKEEYKVQKYSLDIDEKHEKKYQTNGDGTRDLIGFEDTGERTLTFKLRYHQRF